MNLAIVTSGVFEEEKALVNLQTKEVYAKGDGYHDDIDGYIAGIIEGFSILGWTITYSEEIAQEGSKMFKLCGFTTREEL